MKGVKHKNKIKKYIKELMREAYAGSVGSFFKTIKAFQKLAEKVSEPDQEKYEKYFRRYITHEINLARIEFKKLELTYNDSVYRTGKRAAQFEERLADPELIQDMKEFYQKEYLNILKPMYYIEQVVENFRQYMLILDITRDEFKEWFFLGRIDYLKELLSKYIVIDESGKKKEIWLYEKYRQKLTEERKEKMLARVR
ncbi:MAG: hypothetical protein ACTSQN_15490 [Candidatus Heimdallarchaeota archaeon]